MADVFIIEISGITAGLLANEGKRFRFHASLSATKSLEGQTFKSPKDAQIAAARIAAERLNIHFDQSLASCRTLF